MFQELCWLSRTILAFRILVNVFLLSDALAALEYKEVLPSIFEIVTEIGGLRDLTSHNLRRTFRHGKRRENLLHLRPVVSHHGDPSTLFCNAEILPA